MGRDPAPPGTWDVENPVDNGIKYLSTGAGFLPSAVSLEKIDGIGAMDCFRLGATRPWTKRRVDFALFPNAWRFLFPPMVEVGKS